MSQADRESRLSPCRASLNRFSTILTTTQPRDALCAHHTSAGVSKRTHATSQPESIQSRLYCLIIYFRNKWSHQRWKKINIYYIIDNERSLSWNGERQMKRDYDKNDSTARERAWGKQMTSSGNNLVIKFIWPFINRKGGRFLHANPFEVVSTLFHCIDAHNSASRFTQI